MEMGTGDRQNRQHPFPWAKCWCDSSKEGGAFTRVLRPLLHTLSIWEITF